jgi:hypothetical protein
MIKILYELFLTYLQPLLAFAGVIVTSEGYLKPTETTDMIFQYNNKDIAIPKNDMEWKMMREKKDKYEIFSPFIIPRHMVFIANLVVSRINEIDIPPEGVIERSSIKNNLVYDEDLDEYVVADGSTDNDIEKMEVVSYIEMKHKQTLNGELNTISFRYVDSSGNPLEEFPSLAEFTANNPIIATYGAMLNLIKRYNKILSIELQNTDVAVMTILRGLERYKNEQKKKNKEIAGIEGINLSDEYDLEKEIEEAANTEFDMDYVLGISDETLYIGPWDKKDIRIENLDGILYNSGMILPKFKIIEADNTIAEEISSDKFDEIELNW